MQAARELAQLAGGCREVLDRLVEQLGGERRIVELAAREPQRQRQPDQVLLRAVVQVALEPAPRVVGRGDDPGAGGAQLRLRVVALGDVAQVADEHGVARLRDPRDRQLARELAARRGAAR